jgi:hypothetical protein
MTTKEFIEFLQKEDPEGTAEVVVDNQPVYVVERLPGYYDGPYWKLIQDPTKKGSYNILGITYTKLGNKLRIRTMGHNDVLWDNPEAIVELDPSLGKECIDAKTRLIETERNVIRDAISEINNDQ